MLRDAGSAHGLRHVILRYFNVAGADPLGRTGQSTRAATHLIKVAVETALGRRPKIDVFGANYPPHGSFFSKIERRAFKKSARGLLITLNPHWQGGLSLRFLRVPIREGGDVGYDPFRR